jgi:hypothetical protein
MFGTGLLFYRNAIECKNPCNSGQRKGMRLVPEVYDRGFVQDIVGLVFGFELVATEGAVGASQVAGFPREVEGAEGGGNVLGELGAGGGVNGLGGREAL